MITIISVMPFAGPGEWLIANPVLFISPDLEARAKTLYPAAKWLDPVDAYHEAVKDRARFIESTDESEVIHDEKDN